VPLDIPCWPPDWPEIGESIQSVLSSGDWGAYHSDLCRNLRSRLVRQFATSDCRLTCSGTAAIELALRACRVGRGDEVILSAYDYPGNFRTIELLGATPVLVDVAENSTCMDLSQLEAAASPKVVAVIASHLYGNAADVESLRQICDASDWFFVEDACQVHGMKINGRPAGSFGDLATISFGGSKLITAGTGGAILANNERLAARLPAIIDRPSDAYPISPLQAAVIGPQLDRLEETNSRRLATAQYLINELTDRTWLSKIELNTDPAFYKLAWKGADVESGGRGFTRANGLPIGEGFRSMSKVSERRCRKPVSLQRAGDLSDSCIVLDHRALLVETDQYGKLAEMLRTLQQTK